MFDCEVEVRVSYIEKVRVKTSGIDGDLAKKKAIEKLEKKYKGKYLEIQGSHWKYPSLCDFINE